MPRASSSTPSLPSSISILKLARPTAWRSARQPRSRGAVVRPAEGVRGWRRWREIAVARSAHQVAAVISIPFAAIVSSSSSPLPPIEENVLPLNSATTSPKLPAIEMNEDNELGHIARGNIATVLRAGPASSTELNMRWSSMAAVWNHLDASTTQR